MTMTRPLFTKAGAGSGQLESGRRVRLQEWGQCHPRAAKSCHVAERPHSCPPGIFR